MSTGWLQKQTKKKKPQGIFLHMTNCLIQKNKKGQIVVADSEQQVAVQKKNDNRDLLLSLFSALAYKQRRRKSLIISPLVTALFVLCFINE